MKQGKRGSASLKPCERKTLEFSVTPYGALTEVAAAWANEVVSPGRVMFIWAMRDFIQRQNSLAHHGHCGLQFFMEYLQLTDLRFSVKKRTSWIVDTP